MSRRHKAALRKQRLEERARNTKSGRRKKAYARMAEQGILGNKELRVYQSMYEAIYEKVPGFNLPSTDGGDEIPTKKHYSVMKILYNQYFVSV